MRKKLMMKNQKKKKKKLSQYLYATLKNFHYVLLYNI